MKESVVAQSCLTLCDPMDCSPPDFSIHGSLQARILEWVAIPFSRGSFWPRDWAWVSCIAGRFLTVWATRGLLIHSINSCKLLRGPLGFHRSKRCISSFDKQRVQLDYLLLNIVFKELKRNGKYNYLGKYGWIINHKSSFPKRLYCIHGGGGGIHTHLRAEALVEAVLCLAWHVDGNIKAQRTL